MKKPWARILIIVFAILFCLTLLTPLLRVFADNGDGTGGGQDEPLMFSSSSPSNGASNVDVGVQIHVNFNKNVAYYLSNRSHFSIKDQDGSSVSISVKLVDDRENESVRRRATLIPSEPLHYGTKYTVTITSGVKSKSGDSLSGDVCFSFTTKAAAASATPAASTAPSASAPQSPSATAKAGGQGSSATASSIASPANSPEATPGNGTGGGENRGIPVELSSSSVANGQNGVPVTGLITLTFSKNVVNMSVGDANKAHFTLTDSNGSLVPINIVMADDQMEPDKKRDVIIQPVQPLRPGERYTLTIAKGLQSKSGDATQDDIRIAFTTASQGLPVWMYIVGSVVIVAAIAATILSKRTSLPKGAGDAQA